MSSLQKALLTASSSSTTTSNAVQNHNNKVTSDVGGSFEASFTGLDVSEFDVSSSVVGTTGGAAAELLRSNERRRERRERENREERALQARVLTALAHRSLERASLTTSTSVAAAAREGVSHLAGALGTMHDRDSHGGGREASGNGDGGRGRKRCRGARAKRSTTSKRRRASAPSVGGGKLVASKKYGKVKH